MSKFKAFAATVLFALLGACGGGGSTTAGTSPLVPAGAGGTGGTPGAPSLVMAISTTTVTASAPATVTATLRSATGAALAGQVVNFTSNAGLGAFSANSALTDASGVAKVQVTPANSSVNGADLVVGKSTVAGSDASGTIGFQVTATTTQAGGGPSLALALSSSTVTAAAPATLSATLKDAAGVAIPNTVIKFSTIDGLGTFNPSSALSDASGRVSVKLAPATVATSGADLAVATANVNGTVSTATAGFSASSASAPAVGTPSIALNLSSTVVTSALPSTVAATVRDNTGAPIAGQVVKFSTVDGLGSFSVSSALTDATGTASALLSAVGAGRSGADQVVAATTVNGNALQASQGFQLTATSASIASFASDLGAAALSAYGQTNLNVGISGATPGVPLTIGVTSACVNAGKATITPATASTTTGAATFTYRDAGCGASQATDALQATIAGTTSARGLSLSLTSPTVASVIFGSASPTTIYLKGSGLTETSSVSFTVVDTAGNGMPKQPVQLELTTLAGGLTIDGGSAPVTRQTDSAGRVSVLINSGTVPTPVRVKATLATPMGTISTVSSDLAVAVGLPSQVNFSLSQSVRNIEGYDVDGASTTLSLIASDRLANPVPTGTSINFIAEGGQVEPVKTTALQGGIARASANFVAAAPRPTDGRVTVLAYALGEESFLDTNGNNVFDAGVDSNFQDLGSVFLSRKFIGSYQKDVDQLIPLAIPGVASGSACVSAIDPLSALDRTSPSAANTCDGSWGRAYVRRATEIVLSTSGARPLWNSPPSNLYANGSSCPVVTSTESGAPNLIVGYDDIGAVLRATGPQYRLSGATTLYGLPNSSVFSFIVADNNPIRLNPVAAGSVLSVSGTTGLTVALAGSPVPSTTSASAASVTVTFDPLVATAGIVTVTVTSPGGVTSAASVGVSQAAAPAGAVQCN